MIPFVRDEPVTVNGGELVYGDDGQVVTVGGTFFPYRLQNAALTTDLDCAFQDLVNIGGFIPIPDPLIGTDDPRLSDARNMLPGSVFDSSVAGNAGIVQSKLNLNGTIPSQYVTSPPNETVTDDVGGLVTGDDLANVITGGITFEDAVTTGGVPPTELVTGDDGNPVNVGDEAGGLTAARGDVAEFLSHKGVANGYVPLDSNGRMPLSFYPVSVGPGSGTLSSITLNIGYINITPPTVNGGAATMAATWNNIGNGQWFGNISGPSRAPVFNLERMRSSMIPGFPASKITSGVFSVSLLPVAAGVGFGHSPGVLPDPGASGAPEDYLARDMTYKTMRPPPSYEPTVPDPSITLLYFSGSDAAINVTEPLSGASVFYRVNHAGGFNPVPVGRPIVAPQGGTVEAYAAQIGYNNSNVVSLIVPTP